MFTKIISIYIDCPYKCLSTDTSTERSHNVGSSISSGTEMLPDGARVKHYGTGQLWTGVAIIVSRSHAIPHRTMNDIYGKCGVLDCTRLEGCYLSSDLDIVLVNDRSK
jgi:hypothetical protein